MALPALLVLSSHVQWNLFLFGLLFMAFPSVLALVNFFQYFFMVSELKTCVASWKGCFNRPVCSLVERTSQFCQIHCFYCSPIIPWAVPDYSLREEKQHLHWLCLLMDWSTLFAWVAGTLYLTMVIVEDVHYISTFRCQCWASLNLFALYVSPNVLLALHKYNCVC